MKYYTLILLLVLTGMKGSAQAVFNEFYGDPGSNTHEFFELFNTSPYGESLDGYTIVTYFQEGTKKGFYVMDLPSIPIGPKGYFAAASSKPFNYQSVTNSTAAAISWNDPVAMGATGYLKRWVVSSMNISDGNKYYDEELIGTHFNDFFNKRSGGGATYTIFLYQNGVLVNALLAGTGGNTIMPSFITSMPQLVVINVKEGGFLQFSINFNGYKNKRGEYINQDAGTDNGYIRTRDGLCGYWTKSSSSAQHTPGRSNGIYSETSSNGIFTVDTHLTRGYTVADSSFVTYNITSGPSDAFPAVMQVYLDTGSVPGQLDAEDPFIASVKENTVSDGPFVTKFIPRDKNLILVIKSAAGCTDQMIVIKDSYTAAVLQTPLPVTVLKLDGWMEKNKVVISWSVAENELTQQYTIEKSLDGKTFYKIGHLFPTPKTGRETYLFKEEDVYHPSAFYRIKFIPRQTAHAEYSRMVFIKSGVHDTAAAITLLNNPACQALKVRYSARETSYSYISIYNLMGTRLYHSKIKLVTGVNNIDIAPNIKWNGGSFVLEIITKEQKWSAFFVKK